MIDEEMVSDDPLEDPTGELPRALMKALIDPFEYALGLRDGRIIHFSKATLVSGDKWVRLTGSGEHDETPTKMKGVKHRFPRGIDVRLSDIMWVADTPDGS